jgi:hypothetical protein
MPVTEAEWLAFTDPGSVLDFLQTCSGATERKLRLFACACVRQARYWVTGEKSLRAIEFAEEFSDKPKREQMQLWRKYRAMCVEAGHGPGSRSRWWGGLENPSWIVRTLTEPEQQRRSRGILAAIVRLTGAARKAATEPEVPRSSIATLLHDIFLNPFHPTSALDPIWLTRSDGAAPRVARAIYNDRRFDRLPLLADALEDAGCTDAEPLGHLRSPGPHVRGCWAVDLVLGKE